MDVSYILSGQKHRMVTFAIGETIASEGIPLTAPGDGETGVHNVTTTLADFMVGLSMEAGTYTAAQQTDGSNPRVTVKTIVNPDAVFRIKISGGATENTAMTVRDVTTAAADGLTVTTADDWTSPEMDEGSLWGFDGANAGPGSLRIITSTTTVAAVVIVALQNDTVVGDNFLYAPIAPGNNANNTAHTITLTTALTQMRQDSAVATNTAAFKCLAVLARDTSENGRNESYIEAVSGHNFYSSGVTI
jgi:hypothetical protein|tara:strand:+ start:7194 stop:7934 length:741 start_codon:yes stop_codon:yes gene_type:complete